MIYFVKISSIFSLKIPIHLVFYKTIYFESKSLSHSLNFVPLLKALPHTIVCLCLWLVTHDCLQCRVLYFLSPELPGKQDCCQTRQTHQALHSECKTPEHDWAVQSSGGKNQNYEIPPDKLYVIGVLPSSASTSTLLKAKISITLQFSNPTTHPTAKIVKTYLVHLILNLGF